MNQVTGLTSGYTFLKLGEMGFKSVDEWEFSSLSRDFMDEVPMYQPVSLKVAG